MSKTPGIFYRNEKDSTGFHTTTQFKGMKPVMVFKGALIKMIKFIILISAPDGYWGLEDRETMNINIMFNQSPGFWYKIDSDRRLLPGILHWFTITKNKLVETPFPGTVFAYYTDADSRLGISWKLSLEINRTDGISLIGLLNGRNRLSVKSRGMSGAIQTPGRT